MTPQTFTDRIAQAIGDPGSIAGRRLDSSWGPGQDGYSETSETVTRWSTRAVLAVLAEPPAGDERQLLIAVRRHLLKQEWWLRRSAAEHLGMHLAVDWRLGWAADGKTGRVLQVALLAPDRSLQRVCFRADVDSIREAVDLAVVYGLLPLAFSSAYRAGLDAAAPVLAVARG